jgi:N-acetyl-1-D-myo-inositol-2-amino-2-deoxy-alpha-D-glucopyranoside deacetylase
MPVPQLRGRSLLAVFAHPDDESIACGGVLALCADAGMRVSLVCATRGEAGHDVVDGLTGDALAARRAEELQAAADVLGIDAITLLDFEDGMLPWADGEDLEEAVAAAIARWSPDAIVTFDEDGLYWHPDHVAVHEAVTAAVTGMGADAPALYYASIAAGAMRAVVDAVRDRLPAGDVVRVLGVEEPDAFGADAPPPTVRIDVRSVAARKLAALRSHASQSASGPFAVMIDDEAVELLGLEQLRRAPLGDASTPLLEHLPQRT